MASQFQRLEHFYLRWCDGEFIDADPPTLPQQTMQMLKKQLPDREHALGQRQVDVYTGLNVMILLLELHRYAQDRADLKDQIVFYPSGQVAKGEKYTDQLLNVIHYSDGLGWGTFTSNAGKFLSRANLNSAKLNRAKLNSAKLNSAKLNSANLNSAYLDNANLAMANLKDISWDKQTNWEGVRGLETALNVPEVLKQQLENERLKRENERLGNAEG